MRSEVEGERPNRGEVLIFLSRTAILIVLLLPPVRRWFFSAGLGWAYLVSFAFSVSFLVAPLVRAFALWRGILDLPAVRKIHLAPTPLLGGVAVYLAFALAVLHNFRFSLELKGVVLGATVVLLLGLLDDAYDIPAPLKLAGQVGGALIALAYGVTLKIIPAWVAGAAVGNAIITVLWFVAVTNAVQFLDGMDGLAAGLGVITALFFSVVSLQTEQPYLMFLSAALLGACLGFLPYNFRPWSHAQIFLGDGGSSFIGFTLAGLAVMGEWARGNPLIALLTPLLILGVPIFDIGFVSVHRIITGKTLSVREWLAYVGKDHIHHRFEALGLSKTQSVLLIYFLSFTLGFSAILLKGAQIHEAALLLLQAVFILSIVAILETVGRRGP
jgi:UDP-GlcNAc:undecaprenyl-phosphate GlcNAc-1-phosphate transferase